MTTELERIRIRYDDRLDSYDARQYWRDNHAGQDMGTLWSRIRDLESENERLRRELEEAKKYAAYDVDYEPADSCQCATRLNPPCSWCTSDDNPLDAEEGA